MGGNAQAGGSGATDVPMVARVPESHSVTANDQSVTMQPQGGSRDEGNESLRTSEWPCNDVQNRHRGKGGRNNSKYGLLYAAQAPCIECVKYYVEHEHVDPKSKSDSRGYTAISFAEWELSKCRSQDIAEYESVLLYLRPLVTDDGARGKGEGAEAAAAASQPSPTSC